MKIKKIFLFGITIIAALCSSNIYALDSTTPSLLAVSEEQKVIVTNGQAQLFCRVMGKGFPIIVLHGGPGLSQDYLLPQMSELANNNLVIFYDQRGCGNSVSEVNSDSISIDSYISDLDAIRKHFGFQEVTLFGHSWGGFLAMKYALVHPESVASLILSNSMPASSDELGLFINEYVKRLSPHQKKSKRFKILRSLQKEIQMQLRNTIELFFVHIVKMQNLLMLLI